MKLWWREKTKEMLKKRDKNDKKNIIETKQNTEHWNEINKKSDVSLQSSKTSEEEKMKKKNITSDIVA